MRSGSALTLAVSWPQLQVAVRCVIVAPLIFIYRVTAPDIAQRCSFDLLVTAPDIAQRCSILLPTD
jgi:hypothetical protein